VNFIPSSIEPPALALRTAGTAELLNNVYVVDGAVVTVKVAVPLMPPGAVAVISEAPCPIPLASPPLVMVATDGLPEDQLTWVVKSWVLLSEKVPIA
jgi:hypothetical protein